MRDALKVRFGDTWADSLGIGVSPPSYSASFGQPGGGGCEESTVALSAPLGWRHPDVREGNTYRVYLGGFLRWSGHIDEVDHDTWAIHARGLAKQAVDVSCLTAAGETTTAPNTAIDSAIFTRGRLRGWRRLSGLPDPNPYGETTTDAPNALVTLLDGSAGKAGKWWTVRADGLIRYESLPTTPTMHLIPKALDMPVSYQEYASAIILRYFDSTTHTAKTAYGTDPVADAVYPKELVVDATALGEISAAAATSHAEGIIAQGKSRPGYTASIETSMWELLNDNLAPVDIRRIDEGAMIRLHGVRNDFNSLPYHDIIVGRVRVDGNASTVQIDPMGLVTNGSQEDVIAKTLGAAWEEKFKP